MIRNRTVANWHVKPKLERFETTFSSFLLFRMTNKKNHKRSKTEGLKTLDRKGVLLDLPSSSFFSYEISRKREGSLLNAAFLLYTIPFAMDDTLQRDKNLFLFQSFEESSLLNTCKSDEV